MQNNICKISRNDVITALRKALNENLAIEENYRDDAQRESNTFTGRMESRYDTFKEELQYLANNHAAQATRLRLALKELDVPYRHSDTICVGRLFKLKTDKTESWYYLFQNAGGYSLDVNGTRCFVVTPDTPIGQAVQGKRIGDGFTLVNRLGAYQVVDMQ